MRQKDLKKLHKLAKGESNLPTKGPGPLTRLKMVDSYGYYVLESSPKINNFKFTELFH